mgnify:CR=1 FL=1
MNFLFGFAGGFLVGWLVFARPEFITNWFDRMWAKIRYRVGG